MATVTASIRTTDPVVSNTSPIRVRLQFSEGFSFSHSDITVLNGRNIRLTQVGQSQVSYYREYWFLTQTHENAPGYARFFLAADAVTPNLDEDLDFFIYWDSDLEANISLASALPDGAISIPEITRLWWLGPVSGGALVDVRMTLSHDARFFDANDFTVTGDATGVDSTAVYGGNDYWLLRVRLPSSLGNGGSFRMVLNDIHACYPSISQTFDRTFRWNSSGYVSSINTADIPAVLTMSISETYIAISEDLTVTFNFDIDVTGFTASDISVTTGITKGAFTQVSARQYTLVITTPASGNGEGVVSLARNRVTPGNNNASVRFTYIDTIDADLSLSAAAAQNGETVLAQFDFDYDVPNFESSFVTLSDPNATAGSAVPLDDLNRCWQVPITLPQQGEGNLEISLEEDEIGFGQDRVAGQVQFAPTINLNIALRDNLTLLPVIGRDFQHDISITGNNIRSVDVQGLLRPFYHQWNPTSGVLSILGAPEAYYKDLEFEVIAIDRDGTERSSAKIDVIDIAPVIIEPAQPLQFILGQMSSQEVKINNNPSQVEVEGTWMGLDHRIVEDGVEIFGDVPSRNLGVRQGNLKVTAENSGNIGNAVEAMIPWQNVEFQQIMSIGRGGSPNNQTYLYYYDITGADGTAPVVSKSIILSTIRSNSLLYSNPLYLGNDKILVQRLGGSSGYRGDFTILDIMVDDAGSATVEESFRYIESGGTYSDLAYRYIGNNKLVKLEGNSRGGQLGRFLVFDIGSALEGDSENATFEKFINIGDLSTGSWSNFRGTQMSYVGNNTIVIVTPNAGSREIRFYDISGANNSTITYDKRLLSPSSQFPGNPIYLGGDEMLVTWNNMTHIISISGGDGTEVTPIKSLRGLVSGTLYQSLFD